MRSVLVLLSILICMAGAARAGDAPGDTKLQARAHFSAGTTFYEAGSYDKAIAEYDEAYRLLPLPDFLFNIGQAYRLKGDDRRAISYYQRYLDAKPSGALRRRAQCLRRGRA